MKIALLCLFALAAPVFAKPTPFGKMRKSTPVELPVHGRESIDPPRAPAGLELVRYRAPLGENAAYITPVARDRGRRPAVIWLPDRLDNSIDERLWLPRNAPMARHLAALCEADLAVMVPSLRGGNLNAGLKEGMLGEVDDVIAAARYLASRPDVDGKRIYLAGYRAGATLALLTAGSERKRFDGVFAIQPAIDATDYRRESAVYDFRDPAQIRARYVPAAVEEIDCPVHIIAGTRRGDRAIETIRRALPIDRLAVTIVELSDQTAPQAAARALPIIAEQIQTGQIAINERVLYGQRPVDPRPDDPDAPNDLALTDDRFIVVYTNPMKGRLGVMQSQRLDGPWGRLKVVRSDDGRVIGGDDGLPFVSYQMKRQQKPADIDDAARYRLERLAARGEHTISHKHMKELLAKKQRYVFIIGGERRIDAGDMRDFAAGIAAFASYNDGYVETTRGVFTADDWAKQLTR